MALHHRPASSRLIGVTLAFLSGLLLGEHAAKADIVLSDYDSSHPLKVMAIGDSITDDCVYNGAWRLYLQPLLETNGYPFTFVGRQISAATGKFTKTRHEGYCGSVIAAPGMMTSPVHGYAGNNVYLLKIIADTLTNAAMLPDLALIVMGANDIGRGREPHWVATNDMPQLLDLILSKAPKANIILTRTTTLRDAIYGYATNAANVPVYNATLAQMVAGRRACGQNVFLADMFSAIDYSTMFNGDHLHPNARGLAAIADEFLSRIRIITRRSDLVATTLIPDGARWKYSDTGQDLGTDWTRNDYDDRGWSEGAARLGYGDQIAATTLSYGSDPANKQRTSYFRRSFVVPEGVAFTNLDFRLSKVDGAVVWLNGQEVFRTNMPAGPIAYTNLARMRVFGEAAYIYYPTNISVAPLPAGTNVIAVEVHLFSPMNLTTGFDLELLATGYAVPPPSLTAAVKDGTISLSWPATTGAGYALYSTTNLYAPDRWIRTFGTVQTNSDQCTVELSLENAQAFFRLQKE